MQVENHGNYIRVINGNVELEIHENGIAYLAEQNQHNREWQTVRIALDELSDMVEMGKKAIDEDIYANDDCDLIFL